MFYPFVVKSLFSDIANFCYKTTNLNSVTGVPNNCTRARGRPLITGNQQLLTEREILFKPYLFARYMGAYLRMTASVHAPTTAVNATTTDFGTSASIYKLNPCLNNT